MVKCDRCYTEIAGEPIPHEYEDDFGEKKKMNLCWDCDHNVINGGDLLADASEVLMNREEEDYLFDPINTPKPKWIQ